MDYELLREVRGLKNDKIMTQRAVEFEKNRWAGMLKGSIGKDIDDVLSGKKKVRLTWDEIIKYKLRYYKNKIRKLFDLPIFSNQEKLALQLLLIIYFICTEIKIMLYFIVKMMIICEQIFFVFYLIIAKCDFFNTIKN